MIKRLAERIYEWLEKRKKKENRFLYRASVREDLRMLYSSQDVAKKQKEFVIEKLSLGMLILIIGGIISVATIIKETREISIEDNQLQRKSYGEGRNSISLFAQNGIETARFTLELEERSFTQKELEESYHMFLMELKQVVLGQNSSFDEITYDLFLPNCMEGYPFVIAWQTKEEYIDAEGRLIQNELEEPIVTTVTAKITYNQFARKETFLCCVQSRASPRSMQEQLQRQLLTLEEESRENEFLMLPTEYGGNEIVWMQQIEKKGLLLLIATPIVCVILLFCKDADLHQRVEEREEQMRMDYPELVSKLALLLGAGMTVQNAWQKMVSDYAKRKLCESEKRYVYEEMLLTANELKNGVYQSEALEGFGRRCRLPCYNKLATLLIQNLRSGSTNLAILLQKEALEAFEERKHLARRQGEKAGTKLLFPMMLFLMIVMVMVIVPAFITNLR